MKKATAKTPVEVIRDGAIKASIWSNATETGSRFLTVTFSRTYTKDDETASSGSFIGRDLLVVSELARQAYNYTTNARALDKAAKREPA